MGRYANEVQIHTGATTSTTNTAATTLGKVPERVGIYWELSAIAGGTSPSWQMDVEGSRDGTNWVKLKVGTARTSAGQFLEEVAIEKIVFDRYRGAITVTGSPTGGNVVAYVRATST